MVQQSVHHRTCFKEGGNHQGCGKVVVHGVVAFLSQCLHHLLCFLVAGGSRLYAVQVGNAVEQSLQALLACLQSLVGEVHGAAIVGREDKEADGHRRISLFQLLVIACEELLQRNEIAQALSHLLAVDGNHVVVHPVFHHAMPLRCHRLCYLALMMGEHKVHASSVDVKLATQILAPHGGTLAVPSREALAPRTGPAHDMFGLCLFPQGKIHLIALLCHAVKCTTVVDHIVQIAP